MKKFIKNLFTKPVESAPNPSRRAFLGGAGAAAATAAFAGKQAIQEAPQVVGRSQREKDLILRGYEASPGLHHGGPALPVTPAELEALRKTSPTGKIKTRTDHLKRSKEPRYGHNYPRTRENVSIIDLAKAGGGQKFTLARVKPANPEDVGERFYALPNTWKAPAAELNQQQAEKLFPRGHFPNQKVVFEKDLDAFDIMDRQSETGAPLYDGFIFDSDYAPRKPDVRAMKKQHRAETAKYARGIRQSVRELNKDRWRDPAASEKIIRKMQAEDKQFIRESIAARDIKFREDAAREIAKYRHHARNTRRMYRGE